jgi:hypothetical protein
MPSVSDWLRVLATLSEYERRGFIVGRPRFFAAEITPHVFLFSKTTGNSEYA